ncbi:MAG: dihydroorotate dehydrogenase electron transfer subunit [Chloroflexota bacterium]
MKQVTAPIISNNEVMPGVHLIWLEAPQIASEAKPGQFIMVSCGGDTTLPRPLSIHQSDGNRIALLFRIVGKGTDWLSLRQVGDSLNIFGPVGNGFSISLTSHNLLLLAGGIGIAPLYFLAQEALKRGVSVTLLYGTADKGRYPVPAEINPDDKPFNFVQDKPRVKEIKATDDGSVGYHGMVTDLISENIKQADQVFACGPLPMYRAMAQIPELKNKPFDAAQGKLVQVSLEVVMGCGRGVCYGCTIKTKAGLKKVCEHGPVFNLDDIIWDAL